MAFQLRGRLRWLNAISLKAWGLLGLVAGVWLRTSADEAVVVTVSMAAIVVVCIMLLVVGEGFELQPSRSGLAFAGASSGFLNSWTSLSGPPVVLYYLLTERDALGVKGALTGYFAILYAVTFAFLAIGGEYSDFDGWPIVFSSILTILVAFPILRRSSGLLDLEIRRPALIVLGVTAALVAVRQLI